MRLYLYTYHFRFRKFDDVLQFLDSTVFDTAILRKISFRSSIFMSFLVLLRYFPGSNDLRCIFFSSLSLYPYNTIQAPYLLACTTLFLYFCTICYCFFKNDTQGFVALFNSAIISINSDFEYVLMGSST